MNTLLLRFVSVAMLVAAVGPQLLLGAGPELPPSVSWIWDDPLAAQSQPSDDPRYFRGVIELAAQPKSAEFFVTVDNRYVAYVNGRKLGGDSNWNSIDRYDVGKDLVAGKNVLAIEAQNGGGSAGAIAWLRTTDDNGQSSFVGTDARWKVSRSVESDWKSAKFDDGAWRKADVLGGSGIGPWNLGGGSGGVAVSPRTPDVNISDPTIKEYRSAEEEREKFDLPHGFKLELVAAEPLVNNPVCMTFDEQGRLYVSESHTYRYGPKGSPVPTPTNPIVRLDPTPDGKGLRRTVVAEGFDDPVMGMAIRGNQLWAAANNLLFRFDLTEAGPAENKMLLLEDKNKAWNPFGMFVLEWGPDDLLYMSVGNHVIDIAGADDTAVRPGKTTGVVMRMRPDGTKLESLTHGLRVPYSFEFDPFGQLWLLSNGEGNPNRFVRVIQGVDYHCYTRGDVGNEWLAGKHPLAPPCFELPRGACTQLLRYFGAAYPAEFQGNLFLDNWGAHGFGGPNRTIFRYVLDERNNVVDKQSWLVCRDPHFRCSHLLLDREGNLLIADWYGRDDESDATGRIWRVRYEGDAKPAAPLSVALATSPTSNVAALSQTAQTAAPLAAADALWKLTRVGTTEAQAALAAGMKHTDWRVRRLALNLVQRRELFASASATNVDTNAIATAALHDADPAVRLQAATMLGDEAVRRTALLDALKSGVAADAYLRYSAAWQLAKVADVSALRTLVHADDANLRLAGLIAVDVACYESLATKDAALTVLSELIADPAPGDWDLPLTVARLTKDPQLSVALEKLGAREDVPADVTAQTILALRAQGGAAAARLGKAAARRFLTAVESGKVQVAQPGEQLLLLELLAAEEPTGFALRTVQSRLTDRNGSLREKAHAVARGYGPKAATLVPLLVARILDANPQTSLEERLQHVATLAAVDAQPDAAEWTRLLLDSDPAVSRDLLRSWRTFEGNGAMTTALASAAPQVAARKGDWDDELRAVLTHLKAADALASLKLSAAEYTTTDEASLRSHLLATKPDARGPLLGRRVFERAGCVKCHTTVNENALRAPSLQGIGKAQKIDYLVESIFEPSKVIKTGFEIETLVTVDGQTLQGLVKEERGKLRVITVDRDLTLEKKDVEAREVQKKSLMPDGLFKGLSPAELRDLLSYLQSLK
jgi:putative membrane-bound dehydrogenase-like protein